MKARPRQGHAASQYQILDVLSTESSYRVLIAERSVDCTLAGLTVYPPASGAEEGHFALYGVLITMLTEFNGHFRPFSILHSLPT